MWGALAIRSCHSLVSSSSMRAFTLEALLRRRWCLGSVTLFDGGSPHCGSLPQSSKWQVLAIRTPNTLLRYQANLPVLLSCSLDGVRGPRPDQRWPPHSGSPCSETDCDAGRSIMGCASLGLAGVNVLQTFHTFSIGFIPPNWSAVILSTRDAIEVSMLIEHGSFATAAKDSIVL